MIIYDVLIDHEHLLWYLLWLKVNFFCFLSYSLSKVIPNLSFELWIKVIESGIKSNASFLEGSGKGKFVQEKLVNDEINRKK